LTFKGVKIGMEAKITLGRTLMLLLALIALFVAVFALGYQIGVHDTIQIFIHG